MYFDNYKITLSDLEQIVKNIKDDGVIWSDDIVDDHEMEYQISEYLKEKKKV